MMNNHKANKFHIRKGDTVKVLAGNDKDKTGKVLEVISEKYRAIVEGVNIVTKHKKPSATSPEGGREQTEAPVHMSLCTVHKLLCTIHKLLKVERGTWGCLPPRSPQLPITLPAGHRVSDNDDTGHARAPDDDHKRG